MDCSFSPFTRFWAYNEASYPPFLCPLHPKTPPLHPCPDARNPRLSYPKTPFGVSHFAIWGIPFCHLGYPISPFGVYFRHIFAQCTAPIFDLASSFFAAKACAFSFLSVHHVSSDFAWLDKIYFIILSSITLYYHGTIQGIRI